MKEKKEEIKQCYFSVLTRCNAPILLMVKTCNGQIFRYVKTDGLALFNELNRLKVRGEKDGCRLGLINFLYKRFNVFARMMRCQFIVERRFEIMGLEFKFKTGLACLGVL